MCACPASPPPNTPTWTPVQGWVCPGVCPGGLHPRPRARHPHPTNRMTDRRVQKHYLPPTSFAGGKYGINDHCSNPKESLVLETFCGLTNFCSGHISCLVLFASRKTSLRTSARPDCAEIGACKFLKLFYW